MSTQTKTNGLAWTVGWNPKAVIAGVAVLGAAIGAAIDLTGGLLVIGALAGAGLWFWGTREINEKYPALLQEYVTTTEQTAAEGIEASGAATYTLTYGSTDSPLLVKPSKRYYNTALVLTDTSANINAGAEYDMKARKGIGGGSNRELFYDQIAAVESHQDGDYTELQIRTSSGDSLEIGSTNTDTVDAALSDLRNRIRNAKAA